MAGRDYVGPRQVGSAAVKQRSDAVGEGGKMRAATRGEGTMLVRAR